MALPPGIGYCTITGSFIRAILDGPDPDKEPDGVPIPGLQITIKADLDKPWLRHGPSKKTILMEAINLTTNEDGELIGLDGVPSVKIIATNDLSVSKGFTYTATISGPTYPRQTLTFDAPTGATRDLSDLVEVPPAPGATLLAWQQAVNTTTAARDEVVALVQGGGIGSAGKSAYQIAVDAGFVGTQSAWLLSLKGAKGDTGQAGTAGTNGTQGIQGIQGLKGDTGSAGVAGPVLVDASVYNGTSWPSVASTAKLVFYDSRPYPDAPNPPTPPGSAVGVWDYYKAPEA